MIAPSIQLAAGMSAEDITSSVHAFETSVATGASFAEHLDRAVQSSPPPILRPDTQPSDLRPAAPKRTSDTAPQNSRTANGRSSAPQPKQSASARRWTDTSGKAQNSDSSPVQKDGQRQPANAGSKDSRPSDNSRNSGKQQAGDEENSANSKTPFAQAVAQSAASLPEASSATQSAETAAQPNDASMPAALLAFLQASQSPAQATSVQPDTTSGNEPVQTDSSSTAAESATPSNLFQPLNFGTSNAYQAALTDFQASRPAVQSTSWNGTASASQPSAPGSSANSLPSANQQTAAPSSDSEATSTGSSSSANQATSENSPSAPPAVSTDSTATPATATESASSAANGGPVASTPSPASQAKALTNSAHTASSTNEQQATQPAWTVKSFQAETTEPANFTKNLKSDAGQHEAAKPALEGLTAAEKTQAEPVAFAIQQAVASATVLTNHASSPALSYQASANDSQTLTASQDQGSETTSATQGSAGWTDDSTGDSAEDDASAQASSATQDSNGSKSSGNPVEFLPSSAFNSDAVSGVGPAAVHAVAAGTLQSNTGLDNASLKTPEAAAQNFNSAAQEKAFAAWQSVSAQIGRVVNTATLNTLQNGTEMRVQLRTDAFGSMDIRATLEGGKVGAAIGVESAEAHNALLSQLPALQQSLNERQVQLDRISVVSSYGQSGTDFGTGSGKQNGDPAPSRANRQQLSGSEQVQETVSAPVTEAWQPATSRGRLSVQA